MQAMATTTIEMSTTIRPTLTPTAMLVGIEDSVLLVPPVTVSVAAVIVRIEGGVLLVMSVTVSAPFVVVARMYVKIIAQ